ncbi:MAG: DUF222 domain-containing protein [Mycobacterium sp.]
MFDSQPPRPADLRNLSDADLAAGIADWARLTSAAEAAKSAAIAELVRRRCVDEHPDWACDDWDACAAELSCILTVSSRSAAGLMTLAVTLRDRLPKVAALFLDGRVSARTVGTIAWRTNLVVDAGALDAIDTDIAGAAARWGRLSQQKLERAVDAAVARRDPAAVHRVRTGLRNRDFVIGDADDITGMTSIYGRISKADAALLDEAITALINSVCPDDPRTLAQRRSDSMGALAVRATRLPCRCGKDTCPVAGEPDPIAARFVVHLLAEADTIDTASDPDWDGGREDDAEDDVEEDNEDDDEEPDKDAGPEECTPEESEPEPAPHRPRGIGLIPGMPGTGLLDGGQVADLIARGARVRPVTTPSDEPEPGYRPSAVLDRWIRLRDLTCRFPGCDQPAVRSDIDHTIPWPAGPTHPSNNKAYCRKHHLLKTFWPGWSDRQDPDGRLHITTPSALTYDSTPTATLLFPQWNTTTATLPAPPPGPPPTPARGLKMPKRRQTRTQARARYIATERARNESSDEAPY